MNATVNNPRILVVHPFFGKGGGAEVVAARIVEWLVGKKQAKVTLLMCATDDDSAGLQLVDHLQAGGSLHIQQLPMPKVLRDSSGLFQFKIGYVHRRARRMASAYDLCMSTYNEANFGRTGFQYIHHPIFLSRRVMRKYHMAGPHRILDEMPMAAFLYHTAVLWYGGMHASAFRRNVTVVNSHFIQSILSEEYGVRATVIPPAFQSGKRGAVTPWDDRPMRFVSVGRFSADKNLVELVDLFAVLREACPDASFLIIGRKSDPDYYTAVLERARVLKLPLETQTDLTEDEISRILESARFFIGPKPFEHFGMAVVNAINAGCIPLVHDSGGQREIVSTPELRFTSAAELSDRVEALLRNPGRARDLLDQLKNGIAGSTVDDFFARLEPLLQPWFERSVNA